MPDHTLSRWVGEKRAVKRLERGVVVTAPTTPTARALTVHGPRGLRIEGFDVAARAPSGRVISTGRQIAVYAFGEPVDMRKSFNTLSAPAQTSTWP